MISSTQLDLPEHREEVRLACERTGFRPVMMEHLTAENADALKVSLGMVEEADVYLCILAHRYGTCPPGKDKSLTELEYDHALALDKPRLAFVIDKTHPLTIDDVEVGPGAEKLKALKERVSEDRAGSSFISPADLRAHVIAALSKFRESMAAAEAEGGAKPVPVFHRTTAIPAPPESYIAHPYTLLQLRDLVGRQVALNALSEWVTNPNSRALDARVFCFVAIGGMGKSALTWKWFNDIAPNEMKPLAGRMWWSFYESDATFENFVIRALCYVSGQSEEAVRALTRPDREAELLQCLSEQPYLLVLDGLERILIAYHRMDASYLADDAYDELTANRVAGAVGLPPSAAQSFVGQHRLRQTTDPRAGAFLQKLTRINQSRILITTRLFPSELQLPTGHPRPGCSAYFLSGLGDDDAVDLWRGLGVSGSRAELLPIFQSVENHPLLIQTLASEVANDRKAPGNFASWLAAHPRFDPTALPLVQSRTHILEFALAGLEGNIKETLSTIVSFRMPSHYDTLDALLVGPNKCCKSSAQMDLILSELEDRGLIGWDREANRYDAHPIVRGVAWSLTSKSKKKAIYTAIDAYFEPIETPRSEAVCSLADIAPAIERYHTLIGLGRYDDAFTLFRDRLNIAAFYNLAAHREHIEWLEQLFPRGLQAPPALTSDGDKSYALNMLALSYEFSGQPGFAIPIYHQSNQLDISIAYGGNLQAGLSNLSGAHHSTGALFSALSELNQSLAITRDASDKFGEGQVLMGLGYLYTSLGNMTLALLALRRSYLCLSHEYAGSLIIVLARFSQFYLSASDPARAKEMADNAWLFGNKIKYEISIILSAYLQGLAALELQNNAVADERLHFALARARSVNVVELELPILIALATLAVRQGDPSTARERLNDVWDCGVRGPYPLYLADAYNVLSDIEIGSGNKGAAIDAASNAFRNAWCDGPPYAYYRGLEGARARLRTLGGHEPDMPPFDEGKFAALLEVEINPKNEYWVDPRSPELIP